MLATVLAIYAAVISTVSLVISYFAYRSESPKLSGTAVVVTEPGEAPNWGFYPDNVVVTLAITLHNRGRGAITVNSVAVYDPSITRGTNQWNPDEDDLVLPVRIEGNSGVKWNLVADYDLQQMLKRHNSEGPDVYIGMATGEVLSMRIKRDTRDRYTPRL